VTNYVQCVLSDPCLALAVISCVQNAHFDPGLYSSRNYYSCIQCVHSDQGPDSSSDKLCTVWSRLMVNGHSLLTWSLTRAVSHVQYVHTRAKKLLPPRYKDTNSKDCFTSINFEVQNRRSLHVAIFSLKKTEYFTTLSTPQQNEIPGSLLLSY
jgi:hypothetical protein